MNPSIHFLGKLSLWFILCLVVAGCTQKKEPDPAMNFTISLQNRTFTPEVGMNNLIVQLQKSTLPVTYGILQFNKPLTLEDHKLLYESGILIYGYLGGNAFTVAIEKKTDLQSQALARLIRWGDTFKPSDKMTTRLNTERYHDWAIDSVSGKLKLLVQFYPDVDPKTASAILNENELQGRQFGPLNSWATLANRSVVQTLAANNAVRFIQEGPIDFFPLNDGARRLVRTDEAQQQTYLTAQPAYNKVSGNGVNIGICDTGIDHLHNDFSTIAANGTAGATRVYNSRVGSGEHGTHVASIAGGNGFNSENNGLPAFYLRGQAPRAGLGDYTSFGSSAQMFHDAIVNDGTDVTNHSYVQTFEPAYDLAAQDLDEIVRGDAVDNNGAAIPAAPQVWAAGNNGVTAQYGNEEGFYAVFTSAKNTISVGSMDTRNTRLSNFSSLGPTFDGRVKPDVVAPGCENSIGGGAIDAADDGTQGYIGKCGTSMAAPVVTGVVGLMMEQYNTTYGVFPAIHPSTYKTILVQTAADVIKTAAYATDEFNNPDTGSPVRSYAGPDFSTGYGLVDAEAARALIADASRWVESSINATGSSRSWCITVPEGSGNIKVALAWDDEPGDPALADTAAHLVNDLDLVLIAPDGTTHYPWILDPLPLTANPGDGTADPITTSDIKPARKGADHRNNVEVVTVCSPAAGQWTVRVRGFSLPKGNTQSFSVASSHDLGFCRLIFNICKRYPWVCDIRYTRPIFIPKEGVFIIPPETPVIIDKICFYVLDCPGCGGGGWMYCPGWEIMVRGLPPEAIITIFDQNGNELLKNAAKEGDRILKIDKYLPGNEPIMVITDGNGNAYKEPLKLKIDMKSIK